MKKKILLRLRIFCKNETDCSKNVQIFIQYSISVLAEDAIKAALADYKKKQATQD